MIVNILQSIIITFIEAVCCKFFVDAFLHKKQNVNKWMNKLQVFIMVIGFTLVATIVQNFLIKSILIILVIMGTVWIYYYVAVLQNVVLSAIYYGILIGIDYLLMILINNLLPEKYSGILYSNNAVAVTIIVLLGKMVLFLVILAIRKKWRSEDRLDMISNREWLRLSYFPALTIISMLSMLAGFDYNSELPHELLIIAFGLVIMNFVIFNLIHDIVDREATVRDISLMQERTKNQMNIYRNMHDNYSQQRQRMHDYKNQLSCIHGMLIKGRIEETVEYITNLTGSLLKDMDAVQTNHAVVDAVINQKYRYAQSKGITIIMLINDLSEVFIKEEDLVIILSNILDNAIEACERVEGDKVIKFKMTVENNQILISVQNPAKHGPKIVNNKIITTKTDEDEHGIGLLNISTVVEKYDGTCAIQYKDGWFCLSILISKY